MTFKPIETQEELDNIIKDRLARQKEKFADYDQLQSRVLELEKENVTLKSASEASKTSAADFQKQISDLQGQVQAYENKELRMRVAVSHGLPIELAERLTGNDESTIAADAERLASFLKPTEPVPPMKSTEPIFDTDKESAWRQVVKDLTI